MFLKVELPWNVMIPAENMDTKGLMLKRTILVQLLEAFASKRATKELGYYLTVTSLDKIGEGKIREQHTGEVMFPIFKGEILEGVVHEVLRHGVFMRCVPVENVYLSHVNMPDYKYLPGENPTRRCLGFRLILWLKRSFRPWLALKGTILDPFYLSKKKKNLGPISEE
ncbi:hypothetical protein Bca52824_028068 [Brassica carinata]|uniref:DNA-directed RNA polymerase subunit n=1 Tax=Brassica carinata TaxID=52824 RepID=A0A8X8AMB3_BRACI|nr:hypothetical protein Bca52824_028068 [Brassica carinata]